MNARTLVSVVDNADQYYRSHPISERYGVTFEDIETSAGTEDSESDRAMIEIIDA